MVIRILGMKPRVFAVVAAVVVAAAVAVVIAAPGPMAGLLTGTAGIVAIGAFVGLIGMLGYFWEANWYSNWALLYRDANERRRQRRANRR